MFGGLCGIGVSDPCLVRSAIRGLLATGLDPFTRFISPEEFVAMRKYDVTGVGLNLAPAEDFERKIGAPLPPGRSVEVQTLNTCFQSRCGKTVSSSTWAARCK